MNNQKTSLEQKTLFRKLLPNLFFVLYLSVMLSCILQAGPDNIAHSAKITASSSISSEYSPSMITDGVIHISNQGEWASKSTQTFWGQIDYPWIQLDWNSPKNISFIDKTYNKKIKQF